MQFANLIIANITARLENQCFAKNCTSQIKPAIGNYCICLMNWNSYTLNLYDLFQHHLIIWLVHHERENYDCMINTTHGQYMYISRSALSTSWHCIHITLLYIKMSREAKKQHM